MTTIYIASEKGYFEIVKFLLENGANKGDSAVVAAVHGHAKVWWYLMNQHKSIQIFLGGQSLDDEKVSLLEVPASVSKGRYGDFESGGTNRYQEFQTKEELSHDIPIQELVETPVPLEAPINDQPPPTDDRLPTNEHGIKWSKKLGSGKFGDVWKADYEGRTVAVKVLQNYTDEDLTSMWEELGMLGAVKHEGVIEQIAFIQEIPAIVMELAEGGNLNDFLKSRRSPIDWITRMKWSIQLSNALEYLHNVNLIHRDLRCVNILLSKEMDVKISGTILNLG